MNKKTKQFLRSADFATFALIGVMVVACLCVGIAFWFDQEMNGSKVVGRKFQEVSEKYYEEFLYPEFVSEHSNEPLAQAFTNYQDTGFGVVRLRQMLNHFASTGWDVSEDFNNENWECNTTASTVVFVPEPPYGKTDYTARYYLSCDSK